MQHSFGEPYPSILDAKAGLRSHLLSNKQTDQPKFVSLYHTRQGNCYHHDDRNVLVYNTFLRVSHRIFVQ